MSLDLSRCRDEENEDGGIEEEEGRWGDKDEEDEQDTGNKQVRQCYPHSAMYRSVVVV